MESLHNTAWPSFPTFRHTTDELYEKIYRLGVLLTKPFECQVSTATALASPDLAPGKFFKDLETKEKIWKILQITALFTIVIPLLTAC